MQNETIIRNATTADIEDIQEIAKKTWHHTYEGMIPRDVQDRFIEQAYSDENMKRRVHYSVLLLAEKDGKPVGFANLFSKGKEAMLGALYIDPTSQGKGIGSALLGEGFRALPDVSIIHVEVESENHAGLAFYEAKGFRLSEEYDDELFGHVLKTKKLYLEF